jgi:broad specificity phosphatase PhoE
LAGLTGSVALFAHGHIGSVIGARWIGLPVVEGQHLVLGTASLSILGQAPSHPEIRVLTLWNASPATVPKG